MFVLRRHVFSVTILIGLCSQTFSTQLLLNKNGKQALKIKFDNTIEKPEEVHLNNDYEAVKKTAGNHDALELWKLPGGLKYSINGEQTLSEKHRVIRDVYTTPTHIYPNLPNPYYNNNPSNPSSYNNGAVNNQQWQRFPNNTHASAPYNGYNPVHPNTNQPSYPSNTQTYPSNTPSNYPSQQNNYYGQYNNTRPQYPSQTSRPYGNHQYSTPYYYTTPSNTQYPTHNNVSPYPSPNKPPQFNNSTSRPSYPSYPGQPPMHYPSSNHTSSFQPVYNSSRPGPHNYNQNPQNQPYGQQNSFNPNYPNNYPIPNQGTPNYHNPTYNPNQNSNNFQPLRQPNYPGHNPQPNQGQSNYPGYNTNNYNPRPSDPNHFPGYAPNAYNSNIPSGPSSSSENHFHYPTNNNMGPNYDPHRNPPQNFSY